MHICKHMYTYTHIEGERGERDGEGHLLESASCGLDPARKVVRPLSACCVEGVEARQALLVRIRVRIQKQAHTFSAVCSTWNLRSSRRKKASAPATIRPTKEDAQKKQPGHKPNVKGCRNFHPRRSRWLWQTAEALRHRCCRKTLQGPELCFSWASDPVPAHGHAHNKVLLCQHRKWLFANPVAPSPLPLLSCRSDLLGDPGELG